MGERNRRLTRTWVVGSVWFRVSRWVVGGESVGGDGWLAVGISIINRNESIPSTLNVRERKKTH